MQVKRKQSGQSAVVTPGNNKPAPGRGVQGREITPVITPGQGPEPTYPTNQVGRTILTPGGRVVPGTEDRRRAQN